MGAQLEMKFYTMMKQSGERQCIAVMVAILGGALRGG
jgi:hypothetical protein